MPWNAGCRSMRLPDVVPVVAPLPVGRTVSSADRIRLNIRDINNVQFIHTFLFTDLQHIT
jgi:hypothetical protein